MRQQERKILSEPTRLEAKAEVCVVASGSADGSIFFTDPTENRREQDTTSLRDSDFSSECIVAEPLFVVVSQIFSDADAAFSVDDSSEVVDLALSEHDVSPLDGEMNLRHLKWCVN
jgi:hypothetical protein